MIPASRGRITEIEDRRDVQLLESVVEGLLEALGSGGPAARAVRERCLVDVLAGCGELAFGPDAGSEGAEGKEMWSRRWWGVVERLVTPPPFAWLGLWMEWSFPAARSLPPFTSQPITRADKS